MPNHYLSREILDHIVDFLHHEPEAFRRCCPASKPRVSRTRKRLFADVELSSIKDFELWKKAFTDPSNSPAYQ